MCIPCRAKSRVNLQSTLMMISLHYSHSGSKTPLQSFLGIAEQHTAHNGVSLHCTCASQPHHPHLLQLSLMGTVTYNSLCLCVPVRVMCPSVPVLTTPQPSQPMSTSTQSSTWTAGTSGVPSSLPVKSRGAIQTWEHAAQMFSAESSFLWWPVCSNSLSVSVSSPGLKPHCGWVRVTLCPWPSRWHPSSTSWPSQMPTLPSYVTSSPCACRQAFLSR